jgi:hypothetical protein
MSEWVDWGKDDTVSTGPSPSIILAAITIALAVLTAIVLLR